MLYWVNFSLNRSTKVKKTPKKNVLEICMFEFDFEMIAEERKVTP